MTNAAPSSFASVLPFLPKEPGLLAHVERVASLAMIAAGNAGYSRDDAESAYLAGLLHHYGQDDLDSTQAAKLWTDVGMQVPPGVRVIPKKAGYALRFLRNQKPGGGWTSFVEAANAFDEEMEALPYGELSTAQAVQNFCQTGIVPQEFVAALASFRVVSREQLGTGLVKLLSSDGVTNLQEAAEGWLAPRDEKLWRHSVEVAESAAASLEGSKEAYVAGLLHDVGRLAFLAPRVDARLREWTARGFPVCYAEFLISGTDHAVVGAEFLESRGYPDAIVEAVEFHHRPELTVSRIAAATYMAEEVDENLPSCSRDHLGAKRLALPETPQVRAAGRV